MGSNPTPGTLVDPVTGLSRRQQIAIGLLIPLGIVGSTVATLVDERGDDLCPDQAYECATLEPGEPIVIGLLDAEDPPGAWPLREVQQQLPRTIEGHPIRLDARNPGCSAEAVAEDVRELASDPPDEPPAVLVVASGCHAAAVPMAQLLSDSGVTLVMLNEVDTIPTAPRYHLVARSLELSAPPVGTQAIGIASHLRELVAEHLAATLRETIQAIQSVMIRDGHELLVPRTALRDALLLAGFSEP